VAAYAGCGLTTEGELAGQEPTSTSSGTGGGMDAGKPCMTPNDCPPNTDCTTWACTGGQCIVTVAPDGTLVATGAVQGDCKKNVCQGGDPAVLPDDMDIVPDNDTCTEEFCSAGVKQSMKAPDGTVCGPTGKLACVNGLCDGCATDPSNCNPPTECQTVECPINSCIYTIQEGKVLDDSFDNDCKKDVCDAQGNKATVGDLTETPQQMGDDCKVEICAMDGSIAQMNANEGQKCADPAGECYLDSTCVAGACTDQPKPTGTKLEDDGTPNNCKAKYCDGMGKAVVLADPTDLPVDPTPDDCTAYICNGDMPGTSTKPTGAGCGMGNKCCGTNCCAVTGMNYCDGNNMCCASGKVCGGTCCMSGTAQCANNNSQCCENTVCKDTCCTSTLPCQTDTGDCCPSNKKCGTACCNSNQNCVGGTTCQ